MIIRVGMAGIVAVLALLYVWQHAKVMTLQYELMGLNMKRSELTQRNRLLQVELAVMKAPERIERMSRESLHMQLPDRVEIVEPQR